MNALQYMKNVGKSLGYATIDVAKSYNPSAIAFASSAKELGSDLYQSIKDFKETSSGSRSEKSLTGQIKDSVKDVKTNIFTDLRTGNWYNQQRIKQVDSEMVNDMFGDLSFDFDDDFGDFEFEDDDNSGVSSVVQQQISSEQQSTKSIISSMDVVGAKMSGAISTASVKSADYIVTAQRESSKAMYAITNRGFNQVATGLAAVNANISNLVQLGEPLTAHMQNSSVFYARSTEYQNESLKLLKQLVENTSSKSPDGTVRKGSKYTIDDMLSGGSIDFKAYADMLKEGMKDMTSMISSLVEMGGGVKGIGKSISASPLSGALKMGISALIPKMLKNAMSQFNDSLENFFAVGIEKLRNKSFGGPLGGLFDLIKDKVLPASGYKDKFDPSRYNKGKVDWDGISRKALIEVIPYQLSQIVSALTGQPLMVYDYNKGKFVSKASVKTQFSEDKKRSASNAGGDYIYGAKNTVQNLNKNKKISDKERDQIIREIEAYNEFAFHSDNDEFMNIDNDNFDYKKFGMSKETWEFMRQYNKTSSKANKRANRMNYSGSIVRERSRHGSMRRSQEASGTSIYSNITNGMDEIEEDKKTRTLLGVDEYNNDIFFYLQGIYLATTHVSDNVDIISRPGSRVKGSSIQKNGKIAPIRTLTARPTESDKSDVNNKMSSNTAIRSINNADIDMEARSALDARDINNLPQKLADYIEAKKSAEESGSEIQGYSKEEQKELEDQLKMYGGYDKFIKKLSKAAKSNHMIATVGNAIERFLGGPTKILTDLINSAQVSMERVIFGKGSSEGEMGLAETLSNGFNRLFESLEDKVDELFPGAKEFGKKVFSKIFGQKGEDGKRSGGIGSGFYNATVGELKNAGKWVKGAFTGNAANGRRVTKTGIVAVSEGEMIIPAEYNPFYRKKINKQNQLNKEYASINKFYGNFEEGTTAVGEDGEPILEKDKNGNIKGNPKGAGKVEDDWSPLGILKKLLGGGATTIGNGIMSTIKGLIPDDKTGKKEKENISKVTMAALDDIGANKGAIGAGAIIGGGVSLLTGALVGPILGAGIGAATGLIIRSDAVKNALFGEMDEDGDRAGGILNKNITDFLTKNVPSMAKGGVVGSAAAGLFMGSPLLGAVLGSTVGYISSSESAKTSLFGEKDKDGNRTGGFFSKETQKLVKERIPGIGAGAIAGMVAGPFGLAGNIIMGSAIGYAASSEEFKAKLFGEKDENGKRSGGVVGMIRDNLITPLVGIFDKLSQEIKVHIRDTFHNMGKSVRNFILKQLGGKVKNSKVGKAISKGIGNITGGAVRTVGRALTGIDSGLQNRALRKGYSIKNRETGKNMTAAERQRIRGFEDDPTQNDGSIFSSFDSLLSQATSEDQLSDMKKVLGSMVDPEKEYDNRIIKSRSASKRLLSSGGEEGAKIYSYIKGKKFDKAREMLNKSSLNDETKNRIAKEIETQESSYLNKNNLKNNRPEALKNLLKGTPLEGMDLGKLSDSQIMNMMSLTDDEKSRIKDEENPDTAVTKTIPDLLRDIISVLLKDENTLDKYTEDAKAGKGFKTEGAAEAVNNAIKNEKGDEPNDGDVKFDNDNCKLIFTNGKWEYDFTDTYTKEHIGKKKSVMDALINVPVIGTGIGKLVSGFGSLKEKLFGKDDGEGKKGGLFTKLFNFLGGTEDGPLKWLTNLFTGSALGSTITSALSKITLKGAFDTIGLPLLFATAFKGEFDDLFEKLGWGKNDKDGDIQTATVINANGESVSATYDTATGKYIDEAGNSYESNQANNINIRGGYTDSFSDKLKENTARGLLTNKRSVFSAVLNRTPLKSVGNALKRYGSNISKVASEGIEGSAAFLTIADDVGAGVMKFFNVLKKVPILKNMDIDGMAAKVAMKVTNAVTSQGAQKIAQFASNAVVWIKVAFIVGDFTTGYEDAATTLSVKNPTRGERIIAGLLRAIKNFIPIIGTLIPDDLVVDIFIEYIAPAMGMNVEEFKKEREEAQAELDAYNAEHGTNMDWQEYNKTVRQDYTWTERLGNAGKSTVADVKQKFSNMKEGISEKGLGGYLKDSVSTMANTFTDSFKENGGGLGGAFNALGDVMQSMLPGIFGDIAKANLDISGFASKGDLKGMWGVSLPDFANDGSDPVKAQVGIFSKIIGQIPLITNKVLSTPFAIAGWAGNKIFDAIKSVIGIVKTSYEDLNTTGDSINKAALSGDVKGLWSIEPTVSEDNPIGGFVKVISSINKVAAVPFAAVSWVGHKAFDVIKKGIDGIKSGIKFIQDQKNIGAELLTDKNSELSDFLTVEGVPDSPLSGIIKGIAISSRLSVLPSLIIKKVGKSIGNAIGNIKDKVVISVRDVITNLEDKKDISKTGDVKALWADKAEVDPENPIGGIMKAVGFMQKLILTIPTVFNFLGGKIKGTFDKMKDKVVISVRDVITNLEDKKAISKTGDMKALWADKAEVDPENPIGGIMKAVGFMQKLILSPSTLFHLVGGKIKGTFDKMKGKVTTAAKDVIINLENKKAISKTGDMKALWADKAEVDPENPIGGIMSGVGFMQKLILSPSTLFHLVGGKIKGTFDTIKNKVSTAAANVMTEYAERKAFAESGDLTGLWNDKTEIDPDNPIGGIMNGVGFMQKLIFSPSAAFHWVGNKITSMFTTIVDNTKSNFKTMTDGMDSMKDAASEGDLSTIWSSKIELKTPGPLNGITNGIFSISKFFYSIIAIIEKISGPIKDAIGSATDWVGDRIDDVVAVKDKVVDGAVNVKNKVVDGVSNAKDWVGDKASSAYKAVTSWLGGGTGVAAGSSGFVSQVDPRYANKGIGGSTVSQLGCGPATAVMALNQAGKSASMDNAINYASRYQTGSGTDAAYFADYFRKNGANATYYDGTAAGRSNLINAIRSGQPTILMGQDPYNNSKSNSPFGPNNHYVVASGIDSKGNIIVNDPESKRGGVKYNPSILNSVKMGVGVSGAGAFFRKRYGMSGGATEYPHTTRVDETTKAIWAFFRSKGYSEAATAGIMGNLQQESGIDPTRHQVGGTAKGICQWEGGRFTGMVNYATSKGKDWTDLESQLEYMHTEIQGLNYWFKRNANTTVEGFMSMNDVVTATAAFEKAFERAGKPNMEARYKFSKYYYEQFTGKTYNYDPAVGAALAGTSSSSSFSSGSDSSSSTGGIGSAVKGFGILSAITSAFGKIGEIFSGSSDSSDSSSSSSSTGSDSSSSEIDVSSGESANPIGINFSGNTPVELMKSILGKIAYSMKGPRNPEKGSADCSSTVQWAIKKAGGPDIGGSTPVQYNNANLKTVWYGNGNVANALPSNIKPNDVLFFSRPNSGYTAGRQDRVGHVELYAGDGKMIGHPGSDNGPKIRNVPLGMGKNGGLIKVARAVGGGSGLLDITGSASGSRLLLLNDSGRNGNPFTNDGRVVYSNSYRGGTLSAGGPALNALIPAVANTIKGNRSDNKTTMSKDTAALLKVIISLVESLVSNTEKIDNIYEVLVKYCGESLGIKGQEAATAIQSLQQQSSSNSNSIIENSLSSLKATVDSILAS